MPGPSPLTHDGSGWGIMSRPPTSRNVCSWTHNPPTQWVDPQPPYPRVEHSQRANTHVHPRREQAGVQGSEEGALTTPPPPPCKLFSCTSLICCCTDTAQKLHRLQCKVP